uniref:ATPase family protein n=1 Tax=Marseillevirus LCMAC101 TaxID=2506602 RepID=A0A481YRN7_9VIRU|nr:MAG: ATPase family protein [Marseillevirus LCMAC101]
MANPALIGVATTAGIALLGVTINDLSSTKYWYDKYHTYLIYDSQYTPVIDTILMNKDGTYSAVGPKNVISGTQKIPGAGYHYYYLYPSVLREFPKAGCIGMREFYIGMEKVIPDDKSEYYTVWVPYTVPGEKTLKNFEDVILRPNSNEIRVVSIDLSRDQPSLLWLTKICRMPYARQTTAMNFILTRYTTENSFNNKVLIYGERGVGKSYMTMLLKKHLDRRYPNTNSRLYDDFDPTAIGVNIQTKALQYASSISPVIIVIDEIDTVYEHVFKDKNDYDPRIKHAKDRKTFHKMLDDLGNFHHVIAIYTSEFSPDALVEQNPLYKSFLRPGRVDMVLNMTEDNCTHDVNYWERIKNM